MWRKIWKYFYKGSFLLCCSDIFENITLWIWIWYPKCWSGEGSDTCISKLLQIGNCTCYEGYAGSDCSFDLLGPPTISHISNFGFCDKSKEACDEITLFGKYFTENMNTNCFMKRHTVIINCTMYYCFMW